MKSRRAFPPRRATARPCRAQPIPQRQPPHLVVGAQARHEDVGLLGHLGQPRHRGGATGCCRREPVPVNVVGKDIEAAFTKWPHIGSPISPTPMIPIMCHLFCRRAWPLRPNGITISLIVGGLTGLVREQPRGRIVLRAEINELLTRTGPGTPMGDFFRQYWMPAMLAEELPEDDCPPVRVKLLSERMVAFRDSDGRYGLIDEFCAHRGASLRFGRNEGSGLRCPYHGWKYDVTGQAIEVPSEPETARFVRTSS